MTCGPIVARALEYTDTVQNISENYFLDIANESKFMKYRALENNQLVPTFKQQLVGNFQVRVSASCR